MIATLNLTPGGCCSWVVLSCLSSDYVAVAREAEITAESRFFPLTSQHHTRWTSGIPAADTGAALLWLTERVLAAARKTVNSYYVSLSYSLPCCPYVRRARSTTPDFRPNHTLKQHVCCLRSGAVSWHFTGTHTRTRGIQKVRSLI